MKGMIDLLMSMGQETTSQNVLTEDALIKAEFSNFSDQGMASSYLFLYPLRS